MFGKRECREVVPLLWDYAASRLPEAEKGRIEAHLERCERCAQQARRYGRTVRLVAQDRVTAPSVPADWRALHRQLVTEPSPVVDFPLRRRLPLLAWGGGAALAALALILLFASRPASKDPLRQAGASLRQAPIVKNRAVDGPTPNKTQEKTTPVDLREREGRPTLVKNPFPSKKPWRVQPRERGLPSLQDDLAYVNRNPARSLAFWAQVPSDEMTRAQARLQASVRGGDAFVLVPFPRVAAADKRVLAAAFAAYQQEKQIVDSRLVRKTSLQAKGQSFADLCKMLSEQTGIEFTAGRSVTDDKVTVFCKDKPLRDLMKQITSVFGFSWLRTGEPGAYKYELVQDLRAQLLEEELRNRDRNEALIALNGEMERYRKYLGLSPDELREKAKTASSPEEKAALEKLAGTGWGPAQMYFNLSPSEMSALQNGQKLSFHGSPDYGGNPLPPKVASGVLDSLGDLRIEAMPDGGIKMGRANNVPNGQPPASFPGASPQVDLRMGRSELGQYQLEGISGVAVDTGNSKGRINMGDSLAVGVSPSVRDPKNAVTNTKSARDSGMQKRVVLKPEPSCTLEADPYQPPGERPGGPPPPIGPRVTSADVLEAIHKATGVDIVADYYSRLYTPQAMTVQESSLFDALNAVCDRMRVKWKREEGWLQFRSTSFFNDRLKEVPNRLLSRWADARRAQGAAAVRDLAEIAELTDHQLDSQGMAETARALFGLPEWELVRSGNMRRHWRLLSGLTTGLLQTASGEKGLSFGQLPPPKQQQFVSLTLGSNTGSLNSLAEAMNGATVKLDYKMPTAEEKAQKKVVEQPAILFTYKYGNDQVGHSTSEIGPFQSRMNTSNGNATDERRERRDRRGGG